MPKIAIINFFKAVLGTMFWAHMHTAIVKTDDINRQEPANSPSLLNGVERQFGEITKVRSLIAHKPTDL